MSITYILKHISFQFFITFLNIYEYITPLNFISTIYILQFVIYKHNINQRKTNHYTLKYYFFQRGNQQIESLSFSCFPNFDICTLRRIKPCAKHHC